MYSLKQVWLLSICYAYFFNPISLNLRAHAASNSCPGSGAYSIQDFKTKNHGNNNQKSRPPTDFKSGIRYQEGYPFSNSKPEKQCAGNIKITRLTNPQTISENPIWIGERRSLYFADQEEGIVFRYEVDTKRLYFTKLGNGTCGGIIPIKGACDKYLILYQDKICILTWDGYSTTSSFQTLKQPDRNHQWPNHYLAEAKVISPSGPLFFYSRPSILSGLKEIPQKQCSFFNFINGRLKMLIDRLNFGNGVGYGAKHLYFGDSFSNVTLKAFINPFTNSLTNVGILLNYTEKGIPGTPNSLAVDKEGYVWIASMLGGSRIIKVDPKTGNVVCSIPLPVVSPNNLAFGECPNKKDGKYICIYVTTERVGLASPTDYDGALLLIEGALAEGIPPYKVDYNRVFKNKNFKY